MRREWRLPSAPQGNATRPGRSRRESEAAPREPTGITPLCGEGVAGGEAARRGFLEALGNGLGGVLHDAGAVLREERRQVSRVG